MLKSSNPALGKKTFENYDMSVPMEGRMSINGTINKTVIMLVLLMIPAYWVWNMFTTSGEAAVTPWFMGGLIGGFVLALVTAFKMTWAPFTAPIYALLEGLFLGGISAILEARYPGIVFQAVALTFGTLLSMLVAYRSGVIKVTERFKLGVVSATGAIFLVYAGSMLLGFFGVNVPIVFSGGGWFGILFSLVVVVIAALNLVLDFDFIQKGAKHGAPKYMEWYGAFALIVTLVWLYVEFLRLLSRIRQ